MPPSKPSLRSWGIAVAYAAFAYAVHKVGSAHMLYPRYFWFQLLTHFLSASALALLLLRAGQTASLSRSGLLAFVVVGAAIGAVGWELVEYLGVFPALHWWGLDDSLLDLSMDAVGVAAVLAVHRGGLPSPAISPTHVVPDSSGEE